jgi:hypothetical protein
MPVDWATDAKALAGGHQKREQEQTSEVGASEEKRDEREQADQKQS